MFFLLLCLLNVLCGLGSLISLLRIPCLDRDVLNLFEGFLLRRQDNNERSYLCSITLPLCHSNPVGFCIGRAS